MEPGDIFALISDGVFEQQNAAGEQYNDSRTIEVIRKHQNLPMAELYERIDEESRGLRRRRRAGGRHDGAAGKRNK